MSSWLNLQKSLMESHDLIAEIDVETTTLTRIGGYKATPYSLGLKLFSIPTAKSLKGIWRWWARAAIVGAYNGKINYKEANKHLNKVLGGTGKDEGVSLFKLEISDIKFTQNYEDKLSQIINEIDRFFENAKSFLENQISTLKLPQDTEISVSLNPSDLAIIIEYKGDLSKYKNRIDNLIKKGPLGNYFVGSKLTKKNRRIVISLQIPELNNYPQIPRVKLLLMKRKDVEDEVLKRSNINSEKVLRYLERVKEEISALISRGLKFRISLYGIRGREHDFEKVNFALSSLMLSLILGGIGSITKRAFGSLRILSFRFGDGLKVDQELRKIFQELQDKEFTESELKERLEKMCNITINYAKRLFNINTNKEEKGYIPEVPSLSNIRIEVIECKSLNLAEIGNAFVKQTWKVSSRVQGRDLHTWILGLPRFQKEMGTGYAVKRDKSYDPLRRVSSIGVRFFKTRNKDFIIIYGLPSKDWPKDLYHIRSRRPLDEKLVREISIGNSIEKVFDYAFRKVLEYIKSSCQRGVKSG
ncbi:MAG: type III-B CRISPR module RAMP protein Cmr1 [Candidatus Methanomethylicia archaeon]